MINIIDAAYYSKHLEKTVKKAALISVGALCGLGEFSHLSQSTLYTVELFEVKFVQQFRGKSATVTLLFPNCVYMLHSRGTTSLAWLHKSMQCWIIVL